MQRYHFNQFQVETKGWQMTEEWTKDAVQERKEAVAVLDESRDWGGFVVSEDAASAINRILQSLESSSDEAPFEYHERVSAVAAEQTAELKRCAVSDLRLGE